MTGAGTRNVCLLADTQQELAHFMLRKLIKRSGLELDHFHQGLATEPNLIEQIQRKGIKVIVPLGEAALRSTIGEGGIDRWHGRVVRHQHLPGVFVVPGLQPSKLLARHGEEDDPSNPLKLRPPRFHGSWMRDTHRAVHIAQHGFSRMPTHYLEDPDPRVFDAFADEYESALALDPDTWLSWDIETFYKGTQAEDVLDIERRFDGAILRVSFCFRPGYSVSVLWNASYMRTIRRLLASRGIHVGWNFTTFDIPVVQADGCAVNGVLYEGMDAYHLLESDLPKGLEWVSGEATDVLPWKHLNQSSPAWYSCADADVALRNMLWLKAKLIERGQWNLFLNHVVRLMPILSMAGKHGNLVDRVKRDEIRSKLLAIKQELITEIQTYVPRPLFPRTVFKRQPESLAGDFPTSFETQEPVALDGWDVRYVPSPEQVCSVCARFASNKSAHLAGTAGPLSAKTGKPTRIKNPCKEAGAVITPVMAFAPEFHRLEEWNPNSSDQLKDYMRHFNHPIGMNKKDSSKESADAGHLKSLHKSFGKAHPIYSKSLVVHKVSKTIGTYTPEPDADGLIHTQYVNSTSTWRLGSRKVPFGTQIQNWGKRKADVPTIIPEEIAAMKLVNEARRQIIARPGHKLVQIDSSAVEAVMQGYYMNDPEYMALASKSIHAWLCCKKLNIEFTPENVDMVKELHPGLYSKMKVVNYLSNFGGGPKLMADTYPDDFPTKAVAQATQDDLYRLLPTLKAFHHSVRWEAHTKTYLQTPWGYRHYYYDVFKMSWEEKLQLGKDGKRCVAMKPQNSNAAFQKDNLLLTGCSPIDGPPILLMEELDDRWDELWQNVLEQKTWAQFMPTNVSVHDSLCLDTPDALVDKASADLLEIFTRPIPEMHGLQIGAEVEVGDNWGEMTRTLKKVIDSYSYAQTEAGGAMASAA